jgi:hypothetical protein
MARRITKEQLHAYITHDTNQAANTVTTVNLLTQAFKPGDVTGLAQVNSVVVESVGAGLEINVNGEGYITALVGMTWRDEIITSVLLRNPSQAAGTARVRLGL